MRPLAQRSRGNALVEYLILLVAVAIIALSLIINFGAEIKALFMLAELQADDVTVVAEGIGGPGHEPGPSCPYYYNPATGRWHDPDTHLFVSFDDAGGAGCN